MRRRQQNAQNKNACVDVRIPFFSLVRFNPRKPVTVAIKCDFIARVRELRHLLPTLVCEHSAHDLYAQAHTCMCDFYVATGVVKPQLFFSLSRSKTSCSNKYF